MSGEWGLTRLAIIMYEAIISRVQQQQPRADMVAITVLFSCLRVFEYAYRGASLERTMS